MIKSLREQDLEICYEEEINPEEILFELISETYSDSDNEEYIFMFNVGSSSKNQLEEIPKFEQQDIKLGNLIEEEKDFSDEMMEKINKNHISKEPHRQVGS